MFKLDSKQVITSLTGQCKPTDKRPSYIDDLMIDINADPTMISKSYVAYFLATIYHETDHTFLPIPEAGPLSYFNRYEHRKDLGNVIDGDGFRFRGRGYVQITGRVNYAKFSTLLGIDLVNNPDRALAYDVSYKISSMGCSQGLFTGRKLGYYCDQEHKDYLDARRVINGTDCAQLIAGYAEKIEGLITQTSE